MSYLSYPLVGMLVVLSLDGVKVGAISLNRLIVRQNVAFGLRVQHVDIVVGQVDDPHPAAGGINHHRGG
ncbi:TPA: hypothetical protein R4Y84_003112 [Klebsiella michiganensis]|nr:MAG TPA_asm: hypothetical protein [Caudoviricetes sp.]HED2507895.1 hypothetical protein [Klebsiella michiganensis]